MKISAHFPQGDKKKVKGIFVLCNEDEAAAGCLRAKCDAVWNAVRTTLQGVIARGDFGGFVLAVLAASVLAEGASSSCCPRGVASPSPPRLPSSICEGNGVRDGAASTFETCCSRIRKRQTAGDVRKTRAND